MRELLVEVAVVEEACERVAIRHIAQALAKLFEVAGIRSFETDVRAAGVGREVDAVRTHEKDANELGGRGRRCGHNVRRNDNQRGGCEDESNAECLYRVIRGGPAA